MDFDRGGRETPSKVYVGVNYRTLQNTLFLKLYNEFTTGEVLFTTVHLSFSCKLLFPTPSVKIHTYCPGKLYIGLYITLHSSLHRILHASLYTVLYIRLYKNKPLYIFIFVSFRGFDIDGVGVGVGVGGMYLSITEPLCISLKQS